MESPFATTNVSTFILYLEPYLNSYYQSYQNIITLSNMPAGPLSNMVTMLSAPKLSSFQTVSDFNNNPFNCTYVLLRYPVTSGRNSMKCADSFMGADDIPSVFSYLVEHGYKIDTDLTKMLYKSPVTIGGVSDTRMSGNRKMIAIVGKPTVTACAITTPSLT
jgi:hypothetical protein